MAWQAQLKTALSKPPNGLQIQVDVAYFDDADPLTILHERLFTFEPTTSGADMQRAIISEGQVARAVLNRVTAIGTNFPVGTTVAVP